MQTTIHGMQTITGRPFAATPGLGSRMRTRVPLRITSAADKGSYQQVEEPVRGKANPPVPERESEFDQVLKSDTFNPDREILGTDVGVVDAMRFQGALPEVINSRAAILGCILALYGEYAFGLNIWEQFRSWPQIVFLVIAIISIVSVFQVERGQPRTGFGLLQPQTEIWVGRWAMMGIVTLMWIPFVNGYFLW